MSEEYYAEWIGGDGKTYTTDDPEVVRKRRAHGHDDWVVAPPHDDNERSE